MYIFLYVLLTIEACIHCVVFFVPKPVLYVVGSHLMMLCTNVWIQGVVRLLWSD